MSFEAFAKFLNGESSLDDLKNELTREVQDNVAAGWRGRAMWDNSFDPTSNENYHRVIDGQLYDRAMGREGNSLIDAFSAHLNASNEVLDYQGRVSELNHVRNEYVARNTYDPVDDRIRHDIATGQDPRYNDPYGNNTVYNNNPVADAAPVDNSYDTVRDFNNYNMYNNNLW